MQRLKSSRFVRLGSSITPLSSRPSAGSELFALRHLSFAHNFVRNVPLLSGSYSARCNSPGLCAMSFSTNAALDVPIPSSGVASSDSKPQAVPLPPLINVAIIGRPNVGKSTLFNRLCGSKAAIVSEVPGTTRDRKLMKGFIAGLPLNVVDTGGFDDRGEVSLGIKKQVEAAIADADVVLFMLDARTGITTVDEELGRWARKRIGQVCAAREGRTIDVIVLANKTEGAMLSDKIMSSVNDALRIGMGNPILMSATHGEGLSDLAAVLLHIAQSRGFRLEEADRPRSREGESADPKAHATTSIPAEERTIQLAIMGRPNVGKSTLLNAFIGEERVLTGPLAGLTRDSVQVEWSYGGRTIKLVDTAGLTRVRTDARLLVADEDRRKHAVFNSVTGSSASTEQGGKISASRLPRLAPGAGVSLPGIQHLDPNADPSQFSTSVSELALASALHALNYAQVVLLVVEGGQGKFSKTDLQLARKCLSEGRGLVIAANKSDNLKISDEAYVEGVRAHCDAFLKEFGDVHIVACSGMHKKNLDQVMAAVLLTHDAYSKRVPTWILNRWLKDTLLVNPAPRAAGGSGGSKAVSIKYMTQIKARPPAFALFANVDTLPGFFERFLRKKLQEDFQLRGVPIRFVVKKVEGKEVNKALLKQGKHTRRGVGRGEGRSVRPENRFKESYVQRFGWKNDEKKTIDGASGHGSGNGGDVRDQRRRRDKRLQKIRRA